VHKTLIVVPAEPFDLRGLTGKGHKEKPAVSLMIFSRAVR
jgi:hypothetical protein